MSEDHVRMEWSAEEFGQLVRLAQNILAAAQGGQTGCQPVGPLTTVDERCQLRWPLATAKDRRRITEVAVARHLEHLNRHPGKLTGHPNGAFAFEAEALPILDRAIDIVRNENDERGSAPLFNRPSR